MSLMTDLAIAITRAADADGGRFPEAWPVGWDTLVQATREIREHRTKAGLPVYASSGGALCIVPDDIPGAPLNGILLCGVPLVLADAL
jgi:hypothetical protein